MPELTATFETGTKPNIVAATDDGSANAWDSVSSSPLYDDAHKYGALSMLTDSDGDYCVWSTSLGTVTDYYGRIYFWIEANPAVAFQLVRPYSGASLCASVVYINSSGNLVIGDIDSALGTSVATVGLNQWVRVEFHVIHSTTAGFIEVKLFNNPDSFSATEVVTSTSDNNTRENATSVRIGRDTGGSSGNVWIDNVVMNATAYPGPFGVVASDVLSMQSHVFGHNMW